MSKLPLYRTNVTIWSEHDPRKSDLTNLVRAAEMGDCYCSKRVSAFVPDARQDPEWDDTGFFDNNDDAYNTTSKP